MPVTAKLSKRFYEVLGEDVANELVNWFNQVDATYRADLRELNELNFARFDAKLEQRIAELRSELRQEMAELRSDLRQEIARLEHRVDLRLQELESRMNTGFATLRADMVKWLFGMWITLLGAMIALAKLG